MDHIEANEIAWFIFQIYRSDFVQWNHPLPFSFALDQGDILPKWSTTPTFSFQWTTDYASYATHMLECVRESNLQPFDSNAVTRDRPLQKSKVSVFCWK